MTNRFQLRIDDLRGPEIAALLQEHLDHMHSLSPPESVHALDLNKLRQPEITFWTVWSDGNALAGCGALKALDAQHGEVKSMRTAKPFLKQGVAQIVLQHLINTAQQRGYTRLSLETGPQASFAAAHELYRKFGFVECGPFADYALDPFSTFMTRTL